MSLANQKHFLQLGSKRSSSSGNSLCGNISTSPRLRQVVWYWTGRSYPGAQARSFCHPQPVWEGEIFLLGFKEDSLDLKLGCAVEDEIGRPDPNEPDGDGRCQSQRTAVSNQVESWNISFCQRPGAIARYGRTGSASPFPLQHHHHQETCQGIDLIILSII